MPLRILTANLYTGRADPSAFAQVLRDTSPDLVAVQELSANCAEVLAEWGDTRLLDPDDATTGMGIAATGVASIDRPEFPGRQPIRARFDGEPWGFGPVEVVSVHLVNPISWPWRESHRLRSLELQAIEQLLGQPAGTRVVVGDYNSSPIWPLYRRLASVATDAAVEAGTARATWSYFPWSPPLLRIDHAFVQGARCLETRPVRIRGTDHLGLLIDLAPLLD